MQLTECDKCGGEAERYTIEFPNGRKRIFDRCGKHNRKFEAMKEEEGEWHQPPHRVKYRVKALDEVLREGR